MSDWTSVETQLPPYGKRVLLAGRTRTFKSPFMEEGFLTYVDDSGPHFRQAITGKGLRIVDCWREPLVHPTAS